MDREDLGVGELEEAGEAFAERRVVGAGAARARRAAVFEDAEQDFGALVGAGEPPLVLPVGAGLGDLADRNRLIVVI